MPAAIWNLFLQMMTVIMKPELSSSLLQWQQRIEHFLEKNLPPTDAAPTELAQALHYTVLDGGKRLRPLIVYATGTGMGATLDDLDPLAGAIELIHVYSLIHDDLPAMDDSHLRRGKTTCHLAFDEATAILTGDTLQSLAFEWLTQSTSAHLGAMVSTLAHNSGFYGMAGGQGLDITADESITIGMLNQLQEKKTGALLSAALQLAALAANRVDTLEALHQLGLTMGLAFQIRDDILDLEADEKLLGKPKGLDQKNNKLTYPEHIGLDNAKKELHRLSEEIHENLLTLGLSQSPLSEIANIIVQRDH